MVAVALGFVILVVGAMGIIWVFAFMPLIGAGQGSMNATDNISLYVGVTPMVDNLPLIAIVTVVLLVAYALWKVAH